MKPLPGGRANSTVMDVVVNAQTGLYSIVLGGIYRQMPVRTYMATRHLVKLTKGTYERTK